MSEIERPAWMTDEWGTEEVVGFWARLHIWWQLRPWRRL